MSPRPADHVTMMPDKPGYMFVTPFELYRPGGVAQVVINLFEQVVRAGVHDPLVLIPKWSARMPDVRMVENRRTVQCRLRSPCGEDKPFRAVCMYLLTLPVTLIRLNRLLKAHRVAVVNLHYPQCFTLSFLILRWLGLFSGKIILSFHGMDVKSIAATKGIARAVWNLLLERSDGNVACSNSLKAEILKIAPHPGNVATIHNGLDCDYFLANRDRSFGLDPAIGTKRLVTNIANFEHKKGQDVLIKACRRLAATYPDLHLVLAGRDSQWLTDMRALAAETDFQDRISFIVDLPHERVVAYMERSEVFVLPSREEPFGIVILEAGALGLPVVASDVGGIPEILDDGVTGVLVPPDDDEALARGIAGLLEDPARARALGARLREHVAAHLTWEKAYAEYAALAGADRA